MTPSFSPTNSPSATISATRTPAPATISGVYEGGGSAYITGTGTPGDTVFIVAQPGNVAVGSGVVAPDGSFVILGTGLVAGSTVTAHSGSSSGPSSGSVTVLPSSGINPAAVNPLDGGATILTVSGQPGELITVVNPGTGEVLGSAVVQSNGQAAVVMDSPAVSGQTVAITSNGQFTGATVVIGPAGAPPQIAQGTVLIEGSTLTGSGSPGSTVQVVDDQGRVLGSTTVAPDGSWSVAVTGAVAGVGIKVIQDGVARPLSQPALSIGVERVFTSANVFRPQQGGSLDVGFKANADERITVKIFNLAGETVRLVADMEVRSGVLYALRWNGRNDGEQSVAAGVYIISVYGPQTRILKKVVVLK